MFWFIFIFAFIFLWAFASFVLDGPDHSQYDSPAGERFKSHKGDQQANKDFLKVLKDVETKAKNTKSLKKGLAVAREFADNLSHDLESDCTFTEATANGVECEWVVAPGADPKRRVIFLHGGAFIFGSPKGHRIMGHQLSHLANAAVLSVDYRMLPENKRMLSSIDAQSAYHYILSNGPDGDTPLDKLLVAGDSAGGNLALMLSGWSKTNAARKPDGVIGFSPSLDTTLSSPTFLSNRKTDPLLGLPLGLIARLPTALSLWFGLFSMRCNPSNTIVSPLFDELDNLAPTLIHASSSEVLLGDAIRYTNKAKAAGSDVTLQIWEDQIHDWHLFNHTIGSGKQAWSEIEKFIARI